MAVKNYAGMNIALQRIPKHGMHEILVKAEEVSTEYPHLSREPAARIYAAVVELEGGDCGFINPLVDPLMFWEQWRGCFSHAFHCQAGAR